MKGRKPLYSIPARKRHIRPRHVTVPALGPTVSSALLPAITAQTNCHKQHHQQESTYTHPRRRHHRLLRHRGGKLRHRDALFHSGKGSVCARVTILKAATVQTVSTSTNRKERKFFSVFFRIPAHPFPKAHLLLGGYTSMTSVTIWLHSNTHSSRLQPPFEIFINYSHLLSKYREKAGFSSEKPLNFVVLSK